MKKKSIKILVPALLISLVFVFSFTGCSFMGVTIEPPRIHLDLNRSSVAPEKADTPERIVKEPQLEEGKESDQEILADFDEAISGVAEKVLPSVANIKVMVDQQDVFGNTSEGEGVGSGVIYSSDGYVLTNSHVASDAKELIVTLNDGKEYPATLIGADVDRDIAVIKIEATDLTPAEFTSLDNVKVGELAIAVGSPFGLQETVTVGVISAIGRDIPVSYERLPMIDLIQTDAAINPGNSGGALVNSAGQVLGINTMIFSPSGANAGIGFAIPSDIALNVAEQIIKNGGTKIPYIGIQMGENTTDIKGVLVEDAIDGYPAEQAGIKAGDIITAVDGTEVESPFELVAQILRFEPGDSVTISINRDGQSIDIDLVLAAKPIQTEG
jgi:S1-C subfamily serine protease